jgi:hypothetical protein
VLFALPALITILIHIGQIGGGSRLALVAFPRVGGDVAIEAAVVPVKRGRCALEQV